MTGSCAQNDRELRSGSDFVILRRSKTDERICYPFRYSDGVMPVWALKNL